MIIIKIEDLNQHIMKHYLLFIFLTASVCSFANGFVHPGLSHKKSDLDRMRYQVEAGIEPWATTFEKLKASSFASYDYNVSGSTATTYLDNLNAFRNDGYAAYYNALMWYITGDERHAEKCVEIFNSWVNLTSVSSTMPLKTGRILWKFLEGAEIIKHTYDGWAPEDIEKLEAMMVYPGYSTTVEPTAAKQSGNVTFYWTVYNGDAGRHGNQGLFAMRALMAMGIFTDNELMYQRAKRYLLGQPHLAEDLPYEPGPPITSGRQSTSNEYYDEFSQLGKENTIQDYGYNEVIAHNIWENGQNQESSRDQSHALLGPSIITVMCEMAWNQGDDMYGHLDNRPLLGLEHYFRYNLSFYHSFPDQTEPWEPTVENGEFIQRTDRTGRWKSLKINPWSGADLEGLTRGLKNKAPVYEMNLGHYKYRMNVDGSKTRWLERGFNLLTEAIGVEDDSDPVDHPGWGGLKFRRVSPGDPIQGFSSGVPVFGMNVLPGSIEAENYDHFSIFGEGRTYHDTDSANTGGAYRLDEGVDVSVCSEGGYKVDHLNDGEWLSYTVNIPSESEYDIKIKYAAANAGGQIKFEFDADDKTGELAVPFGEGASDGLGNWREFTVASHVPLKAGVQQMKISISGTSNAFELDKISVVHNPAGLPSVSLNVDTLNGHTALSWSSENIEADSTMLFRNDENLFQTSQLIFSDKIATMYTDSSALMSSNYYYWVKLFEKGNEYISNVVTLNSAFNDTVVIISPIKSFVEKDSTLQLFAWLSPDRDAYKNVTWISSNENIATVNTQGTVKTISEGKVTITATIGSYSASAEVNVFLNPNILVIEAEDYKSQSGVKTENTADVGGGKNVGWIGAGDWMEYSVSVPYSGKYTLALRLACNSSEGGSLTMSSDAFDNFKIDFENTGGWQNWTTVYATVFLTDGIHNIRVTANTSDWNFNWMKFLYHFEAVDATGIDISVKKLYGFKGTTPQLSAIIHPVDSTNQRVLWTSSNPSIASVNSDGVLNLLSEGSALIIATTPDDVYSDTCYVNVLEDVFTPDEDKRYYIDCPSQNLRIAADGQSTSLYTTSMSSTEPNVVWQFRSANGLWHIDRNGGGINSRITYLISSNAAMAEQSLSNGTNQFGFTAGATEGTYMISLWNQTDSIYRLQVGSDGKVNMVNLDNQGQSESFTITEVNDQNTGLQEVHDQVSVYPNPVTDKLILRLTDSDYNQYTLYNLSGKQIQSGTINSGGNFKVIDLSGCLSGVYVLRLTGDLRTQTLKIMVN